MKYIGFVIVKLQTTVLKGPMHFMGTSGTYRNRAEKLKNRGIIDF